jgi:hypothetical protein
VCSSDLPWIRSDRALALLVMHTSEGYLIYRSLPLVMDAVSIPPSPRASSRALFLSVEYAVPSMRPRNADDADDGDDGDNDADDTIEIPVPKCACVVGNQLLSRGFVLRALLCQSRAFDESYELRVIDFETRAFVLRAHQHVVVTDAGGGSCSYRIVVT